MTATQRCDVNRCRYLKITTKAPVEQALALSLAPNFGLSQTQILQCEKWSLLPSFLTLFLSYVARALHCAFYILCFADAREAARASEVSRVESLLPSFLSLITTAHYSAFYILCFFRCEKEQSSSCKRSLESRDLQLPCPT
jgi:hypothetical protein